MKTEVKSGADESTFIIYQQYDGNDLSIPSVIPVEYYIENQINIITQQSFKDEIMNNLSEFRAKGGKFIVPIPHPVVVRSEEYQHKI